MNISRTWKAIFLVALAFSLLPPKLASAQSLVHYECNPKRPAKYQEIVIDAASLAQVSGSVQYKNDDQVWILVTDINPFSTSYSLQVAHHPVQETAIAGFLGNLGGIVSSVIPTNAGTSQPAVKPPAAPASVPARAPHKGGPPPPPAPTCSLDVQSQVLDKWHALSDQAAKLDTAISSAITAYNSDAATYNKDVNLLTSSQACSTIQDSADTLSTFLTSVQTPDALASKLLSAGAVAVNPQNSVQHLQSAIADVGSEARSLLRGIQQYRQQALADPSCHDQLNANKALIDADEADAQALVGPTTGQAKTTMWTDSVTQLKAQYDQLTHARSVLVGVFDRTITPANPFVLTRVVTDNQADVEITLTPATPIRLTQSAQSSSTAVPANTQAKTSAPNSLDITIHFGYGARYNLSGGMVISTLGQKQFTTANGQIAYQNNSGTRLLPIAMLTARWHDCNPDSLSCLAWPRFSFGITAKSDDKGTAPEYIFGPTRAFAGQQLFVTTGVYAGQQQRLLGGLAVGQTTTLSAANLPIAKE